jgi:hypothetical protein
MVLPGFQVMRAFKGDFSLFRSFTSLAIIISVLLHVGLFSFLLSSKDSDSMVLISVQYQGGDGADPDTIRSNTDKPNLSDLNKSQNLAVSQGSKPSTSVSVGSSAKPSAAPVSGASIGVRVNYPRLSRVLGESGQVQIEILKSQRAVILQTSSGFKRLDESALVAVEAALKAGTLDQALLARDSLLVNFVFRLK